MPKRKYRWWCTVRNMLFAYPTEQDPRKKQAVTRALVRLAEQEDGVSVITLLNLIYFRHSNGWDGAAAVVGMTNRTAKRRIAKAFFYVAEEMGFIEQCAKDGTKSAQYCDKT